MKSTIAGTDEIMQPVYEDPDTLRPAGLDRDQAEVRVRPVPRPRSKPPPKAQCDDPTNNNTADSGKPGSPADAASSQSSEFHADHKRPRPVRPPPPTPTANRYARSAAAAAVGGSGSANAEPNVTRLTKPPPPPRPPPPLASSIYCDRLPSAVGLKSESYDEASQQPRCSTIHRMHKPPGSPAEELTYSPQAAGSTDRPAGPPQLQQPPLHGSTSGWETPPPQVRPPPPHFKPPPPPSVYTEAVYSEIQDPAYLDVLPEDPNEMIKPLQTQTPPSGRHFQNGFYAAHHVTTEDDIPGLLRWMKRISKSDLTAPSLYGLSLAEEVRSFNQRATNVTKALRLYNLLMMKRKESLQNVIAEFRAISHKMDKMKKKNKTMGIAGGTTGAVGGVTLVAGIVFAPVTMGASLIATAIGAGMVAAAGGMGGQAVKASKKTVNRTAVEQLVCDYKTNIVDLERCLDFILCGMNELRRHDIARVQRAGAQLEAVRMAHLSEAVLKDNMNYSMAMTAAHTGGMISERLLQAFMKELDQYFTQNNGQTLGKSSKSKFLCGVGQLAENLQDELDHLNHMWGMFNP